MIEWIKVTKESIDILKQSSHKVVMIDVSAGLPPFIGWYDPSPKGGGFYFRDGMKCVRVMVSHFIILPEYPKNKNTCEVDEDEFFETLMKINEEDL